MWTIIDKETMVVIDSANSEKELDKKIKQHKEKGIKLAIVRM